MPPRNRKDETGSVATGTSRTRLANVIKSARDTLRKDKGLNGDLDRLPVLAWAMFLKFLDDMERLRADEAELLGRPFQPVIEQPYRWRDWNGADTTTDDGGLHVAMTGDALTAFINQDEAVRPDGSRGRGLFAQLSRLSGTGAVGGRRAVVAAVFRGTVNRVQSGYLLRDVLDQINAIHFASSEEAHTLSFMYESLLREMRDAAGDSGEFYTPRPLVRSIIKAIDPMPGEVVLDPAAGTGGFLVEAFEHMRSRARTVADFEQLQRGSLLGIEAKSLPYLLCQMNLLLHGVEAPEIDPLNALRFRLSEIGDAERVDVIVTNPPFGGEEEKGVERNFPPDLQTSETAILFLQLVMRKLRRRPTAGRAAVVVPNTTLFYPSVAPRVRRVLLEQYNLHTVLRLPKGVFEPYTDIETNVLFFDASGSTDRILYYRLRPSEGRKQYTKTRPLEEGELAEFLDAYKSRSDDSPNSWWVAGETVLHDAQCNLDLHNPKEVVSTAENPWEVLGKLASSISGAERRVSSIRSDLDVVQRILAGRGNWVKVRLGDVLSRRKDVVQVDDETLYRRLRIQVKGRGVVLRDEVPGSAIGTKRQFGVEVGQFVLSKIDARNGAFGVVPASCDGAIITGNFWAYDVDSSTLRPRLLQHLTYSDAFIHFCTVSSPGATNRRYLQEDLFLDQVVDVPPDLRDQDELCDALDSIAAEVRTQEGTVSAISKRIPVLLQSTLHSIFGGAARSVSEDDEETHAVAGAE